MKRLLTSLGIVLLIASSAWALGPAPGNVQTKVQTNVETSIAITIPIDATTSTILVYVLSLANAAANPTITWPAGFSASIRMDSVLGQTVAYAWKVYAPGDGNPGVGTLTASWGVSGYYNQGALFTISGADLTAPIAPVGGVGATGATGGNNVVAPSITPSVANELVVSCFLVDAPDTLTIPDTTLFNLSGHGQACSYYTASAATGTRTATGIAAGQPWAASQIAFQSPTGPTPTPTPTATPTGTPTPTPTPTATPTPAFTFIQQYGASCASQAECNNSTTGFAVGPTTPGDLEVCAISVTASPTGPTPVITSITGDIIPAGWTKAGSVAQGSGATYIDTEIWYGTATGASNATTALDVITNTGTAFAVVNCDEYSGPAAHVDVGAVRSIGTGVVATTATYTTTVANDVLFAAVGRAATGARTTATNGFTFAGAGSGTPGTCSGDSPCPNAGMAYHLLTNTPGAYSTANGTDFSFSANWGTVLVGFTAGSHTYFFN